jgi:hypothetical protein
MRRHYRRILLFAGIVWRLSPASTDEHPFRIDVRTAWTVSGLIWSK